ncbi:TNF receptor-associated factor family protein DDB_G0272098-like [Lucilia sericata]|uniref:TNF receptor-associated factor family protein DDB_G0272098-like n=1 Tax=Lucilia sericata TaxID=13632 RepID=UPI0018A87AD7|nr:TNF receptor-associated factor family protein DDB_G0272098-like [Lucilia sericata]
MRLNLHLTHWSLLFITLISSCFLFYVVASENAKYVTKHLNDASGPSNIHNPTPLNLETSSAEASAKTSIYEETGQQNAAGVEIKHDKNSLNVDKNDKILPNYKKVKKLILEQQTTTLKRDNIDIPITSEPSPVEVNIVSSPAEENSFKHSETNDDEINKKSSDSVLNDDDDVNNNNDNSNSVENKNLFNTIDIDSVNVKANNEIHSSIEEPIEQNSPQQVPDVEETAERGTIIQQHVQDDNADMANGDNMLTIAILSCDTIKITFFNYLANYNSSDFIVKYLLFV